MCRREYDRILSRDNNNNRMGQVPRQQSHWSYEWSYETRRRGATHAWEGSRRAGKESSHGRHSRSAADVHHRHAPVTSSHVRRTTGSTSHKPSASDLDKVNAVSGEWRAVQVIIIVMFIATFGGGWSA